jgi:hypothetical protein
MSEAIKQGDWVTLPRNAQGTVWESGHVASVRYIHGAPTVCDLSVAYGDRDCRPYHRVHGVHGTPEQASEVGEVWRKDRRGQWERVR